MMVWKSQPVRLVFEGSARVHSPPRPFPIAPGKWTYLPRKANRQCRRWSGRLARGAFRWSRAPGVRLQHVRNLMAQYKGQFRLAIHGSQQTGIHEHRAVRQRLRVDGRVFHHKKSKFQVACRSQISGREERGCPGPRRIAAPPARETASCAKPPLSLRRASRMSIPVCGSFPSRDGTMMHVVSVGRRRIGQLHNVGFDLAVVAAHTAVPHLASGVDGRRRGGTGRGRFSPARTIFPETAIRAAFYRRARATRRLPGVPPDRRWRSAHRPGRARPASTPLPWTDLLEQPSLCGNSVRRKFVLALPDSLRLDEFARFQSIEGDAAQLRRGNERLDVAALGEAECGRPESRQSHRPRAAADVAHAASPSPAAGRRGLRPVPGAAPRSAKSAASKIARAAGPNWRRAAVGIACFPCSEILRGFACQESLTPPRIDAHVHLQGSETLPIAPPRDV